MSCTPIRPDRQELWDTQRAFRTLQTGRGLEMAALIASLQDENVREIMDRDSHLNQALSADFQTGRQNVADVARSALWCKGLLDELVFPPAV